MTGEQARAAFRKWNDLQQKQAQDQEEAERLNAKFFTTQDAVEAMENEWRDSWTKLGLY